MIIKEDIGMIIKVLSHAYVIYPNEKIKELILELLKVWDKDKPNVKDLKNSFGRVLYPEKRR